MTYYGYYSDTQSQATGYIYIYLNNAGDQISVSEVTSIKKENDEITKNFKDSKYIGEVTKYDSKIKVHKRFAAFD